MKTQKTKNDSPAPLLPLFNFPRLTLDFGFPAGNSLPAPGAPEKKPEISKRSQEGRSPVGRVHLPRRGLRAVAPESWNKQSDVQRNCSEEHRRKWRGAGWMCLRIFIKSPRISLSHSPGKQDLLLAVLAGGFGRDPPPPVL